MDEKRNTGSLSINGLLRQANQLRADGDNYKDNQSKLDQLREIMGYGSAEIAPEFSIGGDSFRSRSIAEGIQDNAAGLDAPSSPYGQNNAQGPDEMIEDIDKDLIYSPKEAMHRLSIPMEHYGEVAKIMGQARMDAIKRAAKSK